MRFNPILDQPQSTFHGSFLIPSVCLGIVNVHAETSGKGFDLAAAQFAVIGGQSVRQTGNIPFGRFQIIAVPFQKSCLVPHRVDKRGSGGSILSGLDSDVDAYNHFAVHVRHGVKHRLPDNFRPIFFGNKIDTDLGRVDFINLPDPVHNVVNAAVQ